MNKIRKTLVVVFSALFVLCTAMFAAGCTLNLNNSKAPVDAETPDTSKNAYTVSVDVNDPSLGYYTLSEKNCGDGYEEGSLVTFTVKPNEDYEARLSINGEEVELQGDSYTFAVSEDVQASVEYIYKYEIYTYVLEGEGTIGLSDRHEDGKFHAGDNVTVTVTPSAGYELNEVLINGEPKEMTPSEEGGFTYTIENLSGRTYVVAKFGALHTVTLAQENEIDNEGVKGEVTLAAGETLIVSGETLLSEGTEVTLTVKPKEGETFSVYVDGYYQIPADGGNGTKTVTFTVKADTVVKVVWDIYYTVSIEHANSDVTVYLQNYTTDQRRFLAGTEIDFTVIADAGYEVDSVMAGGQLLTPVSGIYTLTVNDNVIIEVKLKSHGCNVSVSLSNSSYGEAGLSIIKGSSNEDGTYAYDSKLTLTVRPYAGYKLNYVTVNGTRVKMTGPDDDGAYTYEVTVTADTKIYVAFGKTERYNVRVSFYSLTALAIDPELNGNKKALPNDVYITASCYEGQEYTFDLNLDESNAFSEGVTLYYSLDGAEPVLWEKSENGYVLEGTVGTENISYILTCELPALEEPALSVEAESMVGGAQINAADYVEAEIVNGEYVYTFLADPSPELCPFTTATASYEFKGWIVTVNGKLWTDAPAVAAIAALAEDPDPYLFHEGDWFNIAYSADVAVTIEAKWEQVGYVLNLVVNNLPKEMKVNVSVYRKTYTDSGELYPVREKNILQITESNTYTIKVSDVDLLFYVEIELRDHMRVTVIDPLYTNDKGGNDFVMDGVAGGANSEQIDPDIWPNEEKILMWGSPDTIKVGTEFELTVTYTQLYDVFVNGEKQSEPLADGEDFTLPAAAGEAPDAEETRYIYHWYKEGDYTEYYKVNDKIEDVHDDLHLVGEWVVPVTVQIVDEHKITGNTVAPDGMSVSVWWRGQELKSGNKVYWSPSIEENEKFEFRGNIPEYWYAHVSYYVRSKEVKPDFDKLPAYSIDLHHNDSNAAYKVDKHNYIWFHFEDIQLHDLNVTANDPDQVDISKAAPLSEGYAHGATVNVTITAKTGWILKSVTADKENLVEHAEGTDVWTVTMTDDITLTITVEKQPVSFPDPDEGTEETSGAPVQGEWQSASGDDSALSFTKDSVTVNGEEVERIGYEGEGGEIVYTFETETKTYTLEWYGKVAGYILALTDTTTSGASPVALFAAEAPANVTYFVSPAYGERYCDAFKGGDAAKLVGEWTAEGQILTFSELEGQAQVSLDGNSAKYLFAVAEGHYLMVIGTTAYDMILEGYVLNVNGVAFHTQYQVTVTEDGDKADGCSYTLKNVDADVGSDGKVAAGTVLTLTVNAPKGYTVSVAITGGSYETQGNTYTITVSTGVAIAITYTAPSVDTVTGAALGSAALVLDIDTTGYTEEEIPQLKEALKLHLGDKELAPAEVTLVSEGKFKATFSLSGVEAGSYAVTLTADGKAVSFNDGLNANAVEDKTTYDFKKDGDAYQLTVTVKVEYTITVNETPADGCSYELKKGEERLELLDNKATVEENTVLTLTVNAPKGYTVSVTITGGSYETQGNTYTITVSTDVTIAITYTAPDPARITAFGLLNMLKDGADIQLVLRFNATNYLDSQENVKADLTLYVGEKTFTAYQVDIQTDIYTVFFHIDPAQLSMAAGSSVDLKLYSEVIGQEYTEIATSVSPDQNSATFNDADIYSVKLENGKVSLQAEKVKYTVTVNETPSDKCSYELKNGDVTVSSGDKVEAGTKLTLTLNLTEGYTAEVKVSGGSETHEGNTYTITVSANTEITITYTAPVVEKKVTGFAGSTLVVDGTGTKLQLVLNLKVEGYTVDEIKEKATVTVNGKTYRVDVTGAMSGTGDIAVHFLLTPETDSVLDFEDGSYKIVLHLNGDYDYPTAGAAPDASKDFNQTNISLKTENDELLLVVATKTTPVEKRIYGFENSNIVNHDTHFSIYLRFVVEGFESVDAFCSAAKLYIGDDVVINATHVDGGAVYVVQFLISADNIPSLVTGKHVLKLVVDGIEGEIRKPASRDDGATAKINNRTYALLLEGDDLYLNITEEKTSFNVTVEEKPEAFNKYTLMKDGAPLGDAKITKDDVLTLTIELPEGYAKATVSVKGATLEGENSSYTIKNATADVVITITYTKEGEEQVREIVAIEGDGKTHFYGEQWFEIHISKDDSDFLKEYDSTLRGRVNGGNAIGFQVKNYDACFFQINVGEDNYEKSFELEWLDGDKVIAVTHYVCTIPEYHHVELTVENDGDGNTATLNPDAGDIKRNTQVVLTITVKEGWTVGVLVNKVAITLSDQDNGTKTYSFKLTDNTVISVTFIDASKPVQVKDLPTASELSAADTYGNNFFNLKLAGDGLTWLTNEANGVVEVRVDDRTKTYNHGEQKGYLVAGDTIQVEYTGIQFYRPKTVTLHWLNVAHVEIARTEVHFSDGIDNLVKNVGDKPLAQTFQDQWTVFDPDNKVHNATYSENTLNVRWEKRDTTNQIWYGIQLYYVKSGLKQGDKVTVKFTVTAQQNCTLQFFENTDFATEIKLTKDVPYSFESKVVTLDGNLYSILLFLCPIDSKVGTDGRVEDGSISISNLEVEKFEYRFTDANLEEQDGNVYFVLQGAYTGFDSVMLTELKEYLCDFEYNDGFNDGNSNDTPVSKDRIYPCNKEDWVSYEVSNGVFKYKIKINELIAYCYYFHFGWKNPNGDFKDLASHSDIHGRTLVYGGHVYTLYNFGLGQSGPEHFYELLGLTVRENKLANWDANKGLTNNYTLNQGEKVVLSATIEDATNWGIVALLKLNGQDGILIAPDKVSSYIGKQTADVSGSVQIGETNYTVTSTPGENLDNAKASGAIVTIKIEYTDSAISVTYTILNAEQANYTFSVTIDGVSGGSCVVGFAQSGGTNASLSVSTR